MKINILLSRGKGSAETTAEALIDSGAGGIFIDQKFVLMNKLKMVPIPRPIKVFNVDGTKNRQGLITKAAFLQMKIGDRVRSVRFLVTDLGKEDVILGLP
ncbi:hypothetical protein GLOTRDRAFT_51015, partial [Gloeophyllum trabeum ATCC 11539]